MIFDELILRALLAGLGVALLAAPLGCFAVWQRMSYFGETVAHSGLLGASVGLMLGVDLLYGIIAIAFVTAFLLGVVERTTFLARDTVLGLLAHVMLALGLITVSMQNTQINYESLLFGDLLAISNGDLVSIGVGLLIISIGLWRYWGAMVSLSVNEELAAAEGVNVPRTKMILSLMMALVVALSMKLVGLLLVTSLLIMPAAASMGLAKSPLRMAIGAVFIACFSVAMGLMAANRFDSLPGPSITLALAACVIICHVIGWVRR